MSNNQLCALSPSGQKKYLDILLSKLSLEVREAALEVAQWIATERRLDDEITPEQIAAWIEDVRAKNAKRRRSQSATILPFRRM